MLSIGKLAAHQAKYYPDQAEVRVDVVQSVGGGVEEPTTSDRARHGVDGSAQPHTSSDSGDEVGADDFRRVLDGA